MPDGRNVCRFLQQATTRSNVPETLGYDKGNNESTPDLEMSCLRDMFKDTLQECFGQNARQTHGTSTVSTDSCGGMCTDARRIT